MSVFPRKIDGTVVNVKVGRFMYGTQDASHIWQLDNANLICENWEDFEEATTVQHCTTLQAWM